MTKLFRFIKLYYREIFRGSYFLIAILLILLTLPREGKFKYEFQKGKPWLHNDLVAPFDFAIFKTDSELISERNTLLNTFKPYFRFDTTEVNTILNQFRSDYSAAWSNRNQGKILKKNPNKAAVTKFEDQIRTIYTKGIVKPDDYSELRNRIYSGITIIINNLAYEIAFDDVYTISKAIDFLQDANKNDLSEEAKTFNSLVLHKYVKPNLIFDSQTTESVSKDMLANLSLTKGLVYSGERIISTGEIVNVDLYQILFSLKREFESRISITGNLWVLIAGQALLVVILFIILFLFLHSFRREILYHDSKIIFILLLITAMTVISSLLLRKNLVSIYVIPFAIIPIFIRTFYDSRLALFIHLVTVFLVGFFVPNSFEFVFIHFIAGVVAIISLTTVYRRGKLFLSVAYIFLAYALVYTGIVTIQEGTPLSINPLNLAWFAGNALLLLATYQLIYLFEKIFGFLSDTTLMELSDTNQELLRKLAEVAPGTFQHSLQVANLAESAIHKIGGNPLLVRAGALYHDIGKMVNPYFFIENQSPDFNPHFGIDFEESAEKIIKHVSDGVQIAKKNRLPEQIIDFIRTHHGTTKVQYFYRLYKDKFPEAKEELEAFDYPGPKPFSKETAVVMMADSIEAASRSLKNITVEKINDLVEGIINNQQTDNQFNDANITFKDISEVKQIFKKKLLNIYHPRIEYPKEVAAKNE
jgi:hypothetical protein